MKKRNNKMIRRLKPLHDLNNEDTAENGCQIDEIKNVHIKTFDYHFQANGAGFED